jgi:hypothetical protein
MECSVIEQLEFGIYLEFGAWDLGFNSLMRGDYGSNEKIG